MRDNFTAALNVSLVYEGGWADNPKDPGGATMKGVTLATYRRYSPGATKANLRKISDEMLHRIYRDGYWSKVHGDRLEAGVDLATFDYAINSGPGAALKSLMKSIGGPAEQTVKKLCARRLSIYQTFKHWKTFGRGWSRRIAGIEAKGVAWALAARHDAAAVHQTLGDEATAARKTATKQKTTAGGAGVATGGGAAAQIDPATADQLGGLLLGGLMIAGVVLVIYLIWRAHVNKERADAYRAEVSTL